jgi:hypothetical protein
MCLTCNKASTLMCKKSAGKGWVNSFLLYLPKMHRDYPEAARGEEWSLCLCTQTCTLHFDPCIVMAPGPDLIPPNTGLYGVSGVIVSKWVSCSPKYLHQRKIPGLGRSGGARAEWGAPSLSTGSPQPLTIVLCLLVGTLTAVIPVEVS